MQALRRRRGGGRARTSFSSLFLSSRAFDAASTWRSASAICFDSLASSALAAADASVSGR